MVSNKGNNLSTYVSEIAINDDPLLSQVVVHVSLPIVIKLFILLPIENLLKYLLEGFVSLDIDLQ